MSNSPDSRPKRVAAYYRQPQDRDGKQLGIDRQRDEVKRMVATRGSVVVAELSTMMFLRSAASHTRNTSR